MTALDRAGAQYRRARLKAGRRLLGPHAQLSYSQEGEDRVLARLLEHDERGFYVDVGAHDARRYSNTYLLYLRGWKGLAIEPNLSAKAGFDRYRPRDEFVAVAIGATEGNLTYFEFDDPALNTLSPDRAKELQDAAGYRLLAETLVPVKPLANVLEAHAGAGRRLDLLSVDVEGLDFEVLSSNDWDRFRPRYLLIEILGVPSIADVLRSREYKLLDAEGYELLAKMANSALFVDRSSSPPGTAGHR